MASRLGFWLRSGFKSILNRFRNDYWLLKLLGGIERRDAGRKRRIMNAASAPAVSRLPFAIATRDQDNSRTHRLWLETLNVECIIEFEDEAVAFVTVPSTRRYYWLPSSIDS